jgi:hypothetical protein
MPRNRDHGEGASRQGHQTLPQNALAPTEDEVRPFLLDRQWRRRQKEARRCQGEKVGDAGERSSPRLLAYEK